MTLAMMSSRLVAGIALGLTLALGAAAEGLPDLEGREITVVTENAYPPLQFLDATGTPVGWEYDAMAEIAKRLNMRVQYQNISWEAMIPAVSEGQYDIGMTGITIREDRLEKVDFSAPYMLSEMRMIVRADEARFSDAAGFAADPALLLAAIAFLFALGFAPLPVPPLRRLSRLRPPLRGPPAHA